MAVVTREPSDTIDDRLAAYLASDPEMMADPYPLLTEIRALGPVYVHERAPAYFVTGYDDVRRSLFDTRRFSNRGYAVGERADGARSRLSEPDQRLLDEVNTFENMMVSRADGEPHQRLRRIVQRAFTPQRIASLRVGIEAFLATLLDELDQAVDSDGSVDLMDRLARRLPTMVVAELLDVPASDRELIRRWADIISKNRGGHNADWLRGAHEAIAEFREYLTSFVARIRDHGSGRELITALVGAHEEERLTEEELLANLVVLLFAGTETTTDLLGIGSLSLMRQPDQWQALVDEPNLVPGAVEELLRFVSPVQYLMRVATEDLELQGVEIQTGESMLFSVAAGNHDPSIFDHPDSLDVRRHATHNSLGFGPHFCLGASLARLEADIVFSELTTRYPQMSLADDNVTFAGNAMLPTIVSLPVRLAPR